jgi:ABC-2 type transport system permease protein
MTFRTNFILECVSSVAWTLMNLGFYLIVFNFTKSIGSGTGWGQWEFFVFLGTTWLINSIVQAFFMPNAEEFSEMIRQGGLDFALLKPMDTQFLVSFRKVDWSALSNMLVAIILIIYSLGKLAGQETNPWQFDLITLILFLFYVGCGATVLYCLMTCLSATSIWLGRNQSLYDFWFYITNFSRYPMEIYQRGWGKPLWAVFTFVIPVLLVVNIPARILAQPLHPRASWEWPLAIFAIFATVVCVIASRWVFQRALMSYRSASS